MKTLFKTLFKLFLLLVLVIGLALVAFHLLFDPNDYRDEMAQAASERLGQPVRIEGPVSMGFLPRLKLVVEEMVLDNREGFPDRPMARLGRTEAQVRLLPLFRRELVITNFELSQGTVEIITREDGVSNLDLLLSQDYSDNRQPGLLLAQATEPQPWQVRAGALTLDQVRVLLLDQADDSVRELAVSQASLGGLEAERPLPLSMNSRLLHQGEVMAESLNLRGDITFRPGYQQATLNNLSIDTRLTGLSHPVQLNGTLALDSSQAFEAHLSDAQLTLDQQVFETSADYFSEGPRLAFDLSGQRLDLDRLLREMDSFLTAGVSGPASALPEMQPRWIPASWTATPTETSQGNAPGQAAEPAGAGPGPLLALDMDGSLAIQQVSYGGLVLDQVAARLSNRSGRVSVTPLSARVFDGNIEMDFAADLSSRPLRMLLTPRMTNLDVGQLMAWLGDSNLLSGRGDLELALEGSDLSPDNPLAGLVGTGRYTLREGHLNGVDINAVVEQLIAADDPRDAALEMGGSTPFDTISGEVLLENGVIATPDVAIRSQFFDLLGAGHVDLSISELDYELDLAVKGEAREQLLARMPRLREARVPVRLIGPLDNPRIRLDTSGALMDAAKGRLEEKASDLLDRLKDRQQDNQEEDATGT